MEINNHRSNILAQLKKRNAKEKSFRDIVRHNNKLLEALDFLQKASIPKCLQTAISEGNIHGDSPHQALCDHSRKELLECHSKIAKLAEQVIHLKDTLDDKNIMLDKLKSELRKALGNLEVEHELCLTLKAEMVSAKKILQDKCDEFDALNMTYNSIENRKNDLEFENRKLQEQLLRYKELGRKSSSNESFGSVLSLNASTGSGKSLQKFEKMETGQKFEKPETAPEPQLASNKLTFDTTHFYPDVVLPGKVKFEFTAHNTDVNAVLWFPDSNFLFTAGADRRVKLWEMCENEMKLIKTLCDCNLSIMSLDMDSQASLLLCSSCDFASRIWTTSDFNLRHTLTGHSGKVSSSKFLKDSFKIVSGSYDQSLKFWDCRSRVCTATYLTHSNVNDVFSKDSNLVISGHNDSIRTWDTRSGSEAPRISSSGAITSLDMSSRNSNHLLVSIQGIDELKVFDLRNHKEVLSLSANGFKIGCSWTRAKYSPDGKYCCCGSKDGSVFVWSTSSGALVRELKSHKSNVISCGWSVCGSYLATCDSDRKCIVWSK